MLELWNTIFAGSTFVVFAISVTIALVQLRALRMSYQMTGAGTLLQTYWSPQFQEWLRFVLFDLERRMEDPAYRAELQHPPVDRTRHPEIYIFEYYALIGSYLRDGFMPRQIFLENGSRDAVAVWDRGLTAIQLMRSAEAPDLFAGFENLADVCRRWLAHC